jgi:hypothetical protein
MKVQPAYSSGRLTGRSGKTIVDFSHAFIPSGNGSNKSSLAVVGRSAPKGLQTKARGEAPGTDEFFHQQP